MLALKLVMTHVTFGLSDTHRVWVNKTRTIVNFDPYAGGIAALSRKNHPRILRSGQSALGGGRSFDVAFIYPFSKKKKKEKGPD